MGKWKRKGKGKEKGKKGNGKDKYNTTPPCEINRDGFLKRFRKTSGISNVFLNRFRKPSRLISHWVVLITC